MADIADDISFVFDGQAVSARPGQTLAGALHAAGRHVISRSFKYHRPRGLFCMAGRCPNCLCTVDGEPNVRICMVQAKAGTVVEPQNAWPSLSRDALSILDRLHRFLPVGFYYRRMYKPRWMWPYWERLIRRIAGLGRVDRAHGGDGLYDKVNLFTDVAVVGGGIAGLNAALAAADAGAAVTLIDEQPQLGGHLRYDPGAVGLCGPVEKLAARVTAHENITLLTSAVAFGCYEGNYLGIQQGRRLIRLRARQVVIAAGAWERPLVFENNDLPGVLLASAAQRLVHLEGCRLGGAAVVVTDNPQGYRAARQLAAAGTRIAAIVDIRAHAPDSFAGVPTFRGHTLLTVWGKDHVTDAVVAPLEDGTKQTIPCRWIVQAVGFTPANSLLYQSGCRLEYDAAYDHAVVRTYVPGVHSAGAVNGFHQSDGAAVDGHRAGAAAVMALRGAREPEHAELWTRAVEHLNLAAGGELSVATRSAAGCTAHYCSGSAAKKKFVCLCEDVTEKDICDAVAEGYSNIETLKRYSTVSMGPCQGKMCQSASIALGARENRQSIADMGVTTSRPPEQPVPLGVLAGRGVHLSLVRRTPLHHWHERHGATMMDAGAWKRPQVYSSVEDEYQAVRQRAGLIDVSTLGKIELRGRDVIRFLEFVYPNRFENLKVGRARYGVVCDEAGIILDDGTISRLADDRFFLTTTTGNADAIDSWFRWWLAARPDWDVQLTNVTGSYAAMNLAGPRSREILSHLTTADLSPQAMPYMAAGELVIAGVPAVVLRLGFVGELGYELHVPSQFGLFVWEAILDAGRTCDLRPFGVDAQRLLRLEKKHFLPGVDSDALSNPLEADLPWIVRLDKDDFIGKRSLVRARQRGCRNRLVGFRLSDAIVPEPASPVLCDGSPGGRITSCSYSPAAGATIGLAWVPADRAKNGETVDIQYNGQLLKAVIQDEPFYDPAGERLKS